MGRLLGVGGLFLAGLALGTRVGAQPSAEDPFLVAHASHVSGNLPSPRLELRLKDGRFRFDPREPIEVDALFEVGADGSLDPGIGLWGCPNEWDTQIVFDRPTDVSFPRTALCHDFGLVSPGVACCGGRGAAGPRTKTLLLNGLSRFTSAGRYRLFIRSRLRGGPNGPPRFQTSNVLTLEIAPREDGWASAALDAAVAVIDGTGRPDTDVVAAFETLGRLASPAAAAAIASRFDRSWSARQALFAIPERRVAVAAVEDLLRRPGARASGALVRSAALLALVERHPEPPYPHDAYLSLVEHYSQVRIRAVQAIQGGWRPRFEPS